jgi:hypothetical protein
VSQTAYDQASHLPVTSTFHQLSSPEAPEMKAFFALASTAFLLSSLPACFATHKIGDPCTNPKYYGTLGCSTNNCNRVGITSKRKMRSDIRLTAKLSSGQMCAGAEWWWKVLLGGSWSLQQGSMPE